MGNQLVDFFFPSDMEIPSFGVHDISILTWISDKIPILCCNGSWRIFLDINYFINYAIVRTIQVSLIKEILSKDIYRKLLYASDRKLQLINPEIQYSIVFIASYWITRCISLTFFDFPHNRQRISSWCYYLRTDILIKRIKIGVRDLLNFHTNQLITIRKVHIVILDIIMKWTVVNFIGISWII